jgi:hypothetical protein
MLVDVMSYGHPKLDAIVGRVNEILLRAEVSLGRLN